MSMLETKSRIIERLKAENSLLRAERDRLEKQNKLLWQDRQNLEKWDDERRELVRNGLESGVRQAMRMASYTYWQQARS